MANRYPGRVDRLVILDDSMPDLAEAFAAAGIAPGRPKPAVTDYQRHFMPWGRPELVNRAVRFCCGDLLVGAGVST